jgi:predicted membrane-bound spermidine synthase
MHGLLTRRPAWIVGAAFFLSGAAALVYQSAWQRLLVAVVGSDLESVTLIVSVFMAGLGLGAWLGGQLADRWPRSGLGLFCAIEVGIGLFGLISPALLAYAGPAFAPLDRGLGAGLCFLLFLPPTLGMGATLPVLIAHSVRSGGMGIGGSTGTLYALNTLGAALGALAMGLLLLHWVSVHEAIRLAALLNALAAAGVALLLRPSAR